MTLESIEIKDYYLYWVAATDYRIKTNPRTQEYILCREKDFSTVLLNWAKEKFPNTRFRELGLTGFISEEENIDISFMQEEKPRIDRIFLERD